MSSLIMKWSSAGKLLIPIQEQFDRLMFPGHVVPVLSDMSLMTYGWYGCTLMYYFYVNMKVGECMAHKCYPPSET